jgi:hypothetical protein
LIWIMNDKPAKVDLTHYCTWWRLFLKCVVWIKLNLRFDSNGWPRLLIWCCPWYVRYGYIIFLCVYNLLITFYNCFDGVVFSSLYYNCYLPNEIRLIWILNMICGHLWHRYSVTANHVVLATVKFGIL